MAKRISIRKKEDTCKTLSKSQMAGLAVLIIRAADLSYIGRVLSVRIIQELI